MMKAEGVYDSFKLVIDKVEEAMRLGVTEKEMLAKVSV